METPNNTREKNKAWFLWKLASAALCWTLLIWTTSCWWITQKDISKQEQKIARISNEISVDIKTYKHLVETYNKLHDKKLIAKSESEIDEIEKGLSEIRREILSYDEKISNLVNRKLKADYTLHKYQSKVPSNNPTWYMDSNKRDRVYTIL